MPDWKAVVREHLAPLRLPPHVEAPLVDELAEHLELAYDRRLASGEDPDRARQEVTAAFNRDGALVARLRGLRRMRPDPGGDPVRGRRWAPLLSDVRVAGRRLRQDWTATIALIVTLAVGIGATAAIGGATRLTVLHPLPFGGTDRLVNVWLLRANRDNWHFHVPPPDADALRRAAQVFDRVEMYDSDRRLLARNTAGRSVTVASVPIGFFDLVEVRPHTGRVFDAGDGRSGDAVLLGDALWRSDFGAAPDVFGATIHLDGRPLRVVGVLPAGFTFPGDADMWTVRSPADHSNGYVLARLRPGVTGAQAQAAMPSVVSAITNGRANPGMSFRIEPLGATATRDTRRPWLLLLAAAGCVVTIALSNVSSLLLSRAVGRRRDVAVRLALGATRVDILRLVAAESAILSAGAAAASLAVSYWTMTALRIWAPEDTPRRGDWHMDATVFIAVGALSLLCWILLTLVPGLAVARAGRDAGLSSAGTAAFATRRDSRARGVLVVVEIALTFVLLVGASLFATSVLRLSAVDPGFRTDHLTVVRLTPPAGPSPGSTHAQIVDRIEQDLRRAPGVSAAAASTGDIMTGLGLIDARRTLAQRVTRDAGPPARGPEEAHFRRVSPAFFQTLGLRIADGREFSDRDRAGTPPVAIVNQAMARAFWGTTAVVGRRVSFERRDNLPVWLEIVGVAEDTRDLALTTAPQPAFFAPLAQAQTIAGDGITLFVRTRGESLLRAGDIRRIVALVSPAWPAPDISTMDQAVDRFVAAPRFRAGLVTGFAAIALFLAALGVYTIVSHLAASRAPEMAVRLALGASRSRIARDVVGEGARLTVLGLAIGVAASLALRQVVAGLLFGVDAADPLILGVVPIALLAVMLAASCLPARRAAMTDAARVMRGDTG